MGKTSGYGIRQVHAKTKNRDSYIKSTSYENPCLYTPLDIFGHCQNRPDFLLFQQTRYAELDEIGFILSYLQVSGKSHEA